MTKKNYYYAVASGKTPGVYKTWKEVQIQVKRYPNAIFKKFTIRSDAEAFVRRKQPATLSLSLKEIEASQAATRISGPPKIATSKRKLDHGHDDEKAAKESKDRINHMLNVDICQIEVFLL